MPHGGMFQDPNLLNKRAAEYLEYQLNAAPFVQSSSDIWKPPLQSIFKLNFNAAIFSESNSSWFGGIIRNDKGEVMAAMSAKVPSLSSSEEAEMLACRKAMEFATVAGFLELVVEGDKC